MKKFSFALQKVLDLRAFSENEARMDLGKAVADVNRIQSDIDTLVQNRALAVAELAQKTQTVGTNFSLGINEIQSIERYSTLLDVKRDQLLEDLAAAELVADEKREVFAESMKNRKTLSTLKDKHYKQYRGEAQRAEDVLLDDIGGRLTRGGGS